MIRLNGTSLPQIFGNFARNAMSMENNLRDKGISSTVLTKSVMQDLRQIIEQSRRKVASTVNSELTLMYWHIGGRINREVLGNERAEYGK